MTLGLSSASRAFVSRMVGSSVHLRGAPAVWDEPRAGHKEWLHFTIHGPGVDIVVNFSLSSGGGAGDVRQGRVGCLIHREGFQGDIDSCAPHLLRARTGESCVQMGQSSVVFRDGGFDLTVHLEREPIALQLRLEPETAPAQINNFEIEGGPALNWLVVPRLVASGWVTLGAQQLELERAPAYHDHNWGGFRWGANFSWEWGYALPAETNAWSCVFARLSDRSRFSDLMTGLFVWKGSMQHRVFSGDELSVTHHGLFHGRRPLRLPRVMGLLAESRPADVPARFEVRARRHTDWLDLTFDVTDVAQVVIPNDDDLGLTIINECCGNFAWQGELAGERIAFQGRSIFEFLSD